MNKDKCLENLYNGMETTVEIFCSKCTNNDFAVEIDDSEYFYDLGWRATDNYVYCPKCAKKCLKNSK